ncbi:MAG TPA: type II secretion system protein [Nevskiaceae bacterium]|nr:type II secretion system protein [Nevskiaceae bacterium]
MLSKLKQRKEEKGFTIIEVLIVLAIAGLILLIVFLAVPALQRNSRNTSRKNDVARVGGAATEFLSNNGGTLPTNSAADLTTLNNSIGKMSEYASTDLSVAAGAQAALGSTNLSTVRIVTGAKCGTNGAAVAGTSRQMVVQYMVETSGNPNAICQDV